ncbi:phosphoglycerate dehydrogenase [Actinoplanes philippinensis]|uniref:Phosphoglycerate dehydrogenase n=1 Tax=Actinoplanes philippinensis TaxID=35752 RepID=A0A1I2HMW0_9ACTN|nr:phosphoglycerate dehydrogenase [Actinoplanes philippinensis]GIE74181.1 phosphoglycerate dehydrogenase [Actinoplanes philippinensis]SFF31454.1 Phosphoglycerate dehydrogenase [Actinoplanes philippinensis]
MKVLLPGSVALDPDLPEGVHGVVYDVHAPVPEQHTDAEVFVAWGNSGDNLADAARRLKAVRWVQTLAAGPDAVLQAGFAADVVVTAGLGLHDRTVAEHTLGLVLAAARRLNLLVRAQIGRRWAGELGGLQPVRDSGSFRTLGDANVVVWGFGGIAARLAPLLAALGAHVTGVARHAGERHGFPVVTAGALPELLPATDLLISILPATPATTGLVGAGVFELLPDHAWVVNVGRGATLDETALLAAIRSGRLAGAALDVFETEPLPVTSGLWDEPGVIITPHAAGGRPEGASGLLSDNIAAYREGRPLRNLVAR